MTARTKQKLDENMELMIQSIKRILDIKMAENDTREQQIRRLIYNALSWTADDVLEQAMEDELKFAHFYLEGKLIAAFNPMIYMVYKTGYTYRVVNKFTGSDITFFDGNHTLEYKPMEG